MPIIVSINTTLHCSERNPFTLEERIQLQQKEGDFIWNWIPMALKFIMFLGCISLLFAADYTSSLFDFVGFVNPSDNFLALTIVRNQLGCFSACIGNNNCYFFDYCGNSSPTSCFLYDRSINSSDNTVYTKGQCQRYKLVSISLKAHNWNKFQKRINILKNVV